MEKTTSGISMAERFVGTEIISNKSIIKDLQRELDQTYKMINTLNEMKEDVRYAHRNDIVKSIWDLEEQSIELENKIKSYQESIVELQSLDSDGKQALLDKFISENNIHDENIDDENTDRFMNDYFRSKRFQVANYVQESVFETIERQSELDWLIPHSYKIATMDKIVQFSDDDIKELIEQLKNDKEIQKLVNKTRTVKKNSGKIDNALKAYWNIANPVGTSTLILAGIPSVVASMFGVQHPVVEVGLVAGGLGALTSISAVFAPFIADAIEKRASKKRNLINEQISDKIDETIQEF